MKRLIIALVVIALVAVGGYFVYQQLQTAETPADATATSAALSSSVPDVNTLAVDTGTAEVSAEGQIVPARFVALSFPGSGEIVEILVAEDDMVQLDDALVRLDTADQEIALQQAEAGLAQAQANLDAANAGRQAAEAGIAAADINIRAAEAALALAQAPPTTEQIAVSEAAVALAQANIAAAAGSQSLTLEGPSEGERLLAEAQIVAAQAAQKPIQDALGMATRFELPQETIDDITVQYNAAVANVQAAEATLAELSAGATAPERAAVANAVGAAQGQRDAAQAQLALLLAGAQIEQIAIAETAVTRANAAKMEAEIGLAQAETAVTQAEAAVTQAESLVAAAQDALNQRTLTAPFAGTVANLEAELGEVATAGVPIVTLADFSEWRVETTDLTELDVVAIANGYPVSVRVDALPGETVNGTVTDIARAASLNQGDVTYQVQITLDEATDLPLHWGMTAFVDIETR